MQPGKDKMEEKDPIGKIYKRTAIFLGLSLLTVLSAGGIIKLLESQPRYTLEHRDLTGDGRKDYFVTCNASNKEWALIAQEDESFKEAEIKTQDGCPFYFSKDGYYDSWGHYFSNDSTEKLNQRTRELMIK